MKNTRCDKFKKYVEQHRLAKGLSWADVEANAGRKYKGLADAVRKTVKSHAPANPTAHTLRGIALGLGLAPEEVALAAMGYPVDPEAIWNSAGRKLARDIDALPAQYQEHLRIQVIAYQSLVAHGREVDHDADK